MADSATLEVVIRDKSGAAPGGRPPGPPSQAPAGTPQPGPSFTPTAAPSSIDKSVISAATTAATAAATAAGIEAAKRINRPNQTGGPSVGGSPPNTPVNFLTVPPGGGGLTPPSGPGAMVPKNYPLAIPRQEVFFQDVPKAGMAFKNVLGETTSGLSAVAAGLKGLLGPIGIATVVIGGLDKAISGSMAFFTRRFREQTAIQAAGFSKDYRDILMEQNKAFHWTDYLPFGGTRKAMRDQENAFMERTKMLDQGIFNHAQELAPFSAPIAMGLAQVQISQLQQKMAEAQILGSSYGAYEAAKGRLQSALGRRQALERVGPVEGAAYRRGIEAEMAELANRYAQSKDVEKRAKAEKIWESVDESMKGIPFAIDNMRMELADEIRKLRREMQDDPANNPIDWANQLLRGAIGNLPGRAQDQRGLGQDAGAGVNPIFGGMGGPWGTGTGGAYGNNAGYGRDY